MQPLVSILVPCYNQEKFIESALRGINEQQLDFKTEVLIGDDASADLTAEICANYKFTNTHISIRYFRNHQNLGVIGNWRSLLSKASGKYLAVCEGDDYWTDSKKLKTQIQILEARPDICICFHQTRYFDTDSGKTLKLSPETDTHTVTSINHLAQKNYIDNVSVVCRNLMNNNSYPEWVFQEGLPVPDYLWHMYNAQFGDVYYIDQCMADYRIRPDSVWSSVDKLKQALSIIDLLIVPLLQNITNEKVVNGLNSQIMYIFYDYAISSVDEKGTNELIERVNNLVPKDFITRFMLEQSKNHILQNRMLKESFSYKIGSLLLAPKRLITRGK